MTITAISQFDDTLHIPLKTGDTRYLIPTPTDFDWRSFDFTAWLRGLSSVDGGENFTGATFDGTEVLLIANKVRFDTEVGAAVPPGAEITLATPQKTITFSALEFTEATANDGSIANTITLTVAHDWFTGVNDAAVPGAVITNTPAGLTASLIRTSAYTAVLSLAGNATAHDVGDSITDLTVTLGDTSFAGGVANDVTNAVFNSLSITFTAPA